MRGNAHTINATTNGDIGAARVEHILRHQWVIAPFRADRAVLLEPRTQWFLVDAHRNHCGPYTAAGQLIRQLAMHAAARNPRLLEAHQLTLLSISPDVRSHVAAAADVTRWLSVSREGNQRSWTLRWAHGVTDFLLDYVAQVPISPLGVSFENVDMAEPLDQEFLAVLLRRADPERLLIRICSSTERLDDQLLSALKSFALTTRPRPAVPGNGIPKNWHYWLQEHSGGWKGEWLALSDLSKYIDLTVNPPTTSTLDEALGTAIAQMSLPQRCELANDYVKSNCTSERLLAKRAYISLGDADRKMLHLARAKELEGLNLDCLRLGAIPFHYEQAFASSAPLLAASSLCMDLAFYDAALDLALRGRRMSGDHSRDYGTFTRNALFSLLLLGRFEEAEALCAEVLANSKDAAMQARIAYAKAILYARYHAPARRDYAAARVWVEKALAFTSMLPSSQDSAADIAFLRNTLALVELRTGKVDVAYQLLSDAMDYLAKNAPDGHLAERTVLLHNRARLHTAMKKPANAIEDLTRLLEGQPGESAAYFDRALIHQQLGRHQEALRDYNAAIQWSPPYPESYFNRAESLEALGRHEEALADYARVLVLSPNHVGALINRARLSYGQGNFVAVRRDVEIGLTVSPANAKLLCLRGLLDIKDGHLDRAYESFTKAIASDESLADAWANRAIVLFKRSDLASAAADLTRALTLREDANASYNRGRVFEAQGKWSEAIEDYSRALDLAGEKSQHIVAHLDRCRKEAGREESDDHCPVARGGENEQPLEVNCLTQPQHAPESGPLQFD